jgi:hypothetical protein
MTKVYFTADTHFFHANIIKHCPDRPYLLGTSVFCLFCDKGLNADQSKRISTVEVLFLCVCLNHNLLVLLDY